MGTWMRLATAGTISKAGVEVSAEMLRSMAAGFGDTVPIVDTANGSQALGWVEHVRFVEATGTLEGHASWIDGVAPPERLSISFLLEKRDPTTGAPTGPRIVEVFASEDPP